MNLIQILVAVWYFTLRAHAYKIVWDNDAVVDFNEIEEYIRSEEARLPNWIFIFPGTKWCGPGNISENVNDLGTERDTDKCCRTHDMCSDIIPAHESKHNLTNPSFYTRLHCDCDTDFYKCLKTIKTRTATKVGHLYFTILGTKCYRYDYPIIGCNKYTFFPSRKCIDYQHDPTKNKVYQWYDVPNF
ncbi:phospholipase A2-like isoform X2 [Cylas formicarius]|uniref:phospholipase A2-like isoform X2 n=1 Tax=Cylas formicarius TaxID=197179 RepID=UPI0029588985|nr:phospholipase A2-like isoform X2 [Cylas formicarius]